MFAQNGLVVSMSYLCNDYVGLFNSHCFMAHIEKQGSHFKQTFYMSALLLLVSLLLTAGMWLKLHKGSFHAWTREQYAGRIVGITEEELAVVDKFGKITTARVSKTTRIHSRLATPLRVGDFILVVGSVAPETHIVNARVVRVLSGKGTR